MIRPTFVLAALCATATAMAAPPAVPEVTVGAGQVKQLRFDFEIIPRSNYYELWFKSNPGSAEVKFFESVPWHPYFVNNVSAHLLDWEQARYRVTACNPSGCSSTAPISVASLRKDVVGKFKAAHPFEGGRFGRTVTVSEDGNTAAVLAPGDTDGAGDLQPSTIYLYSRASSGWRLQRRLPLTSHIDGGFTLALSADGNTLAIAAQGEKQLEDMESRGVVLVYTRSGTTWTRQAWIEVAVGFDGSFGEYVDLDDAGNTLVIGMNLEGVRIYTRANGTWSYTGYLQDPPGDLYDGVGCTHAVISGDGKAAVRSCELGEVADETWVEVFTAPDWKRRDLIVYPGLQSDNYTRAYATNLDRTGDVIAFGYYQYGGSGAHVDVYRREATGYQRSARLGPGAWFPQAADTRSSFGFRIELSSDAQVLAVGDFGDTGTGSGSLKPPLGPGTVPTGAAYIYDRRGTGWGLRRVLKPNDPAPAGTDFAVSMAFGNKGRTLLVGEPGSEGNSGTFWMY